MEKTEGYKIQNKYRYITYKKTLKDCKEASARFWSENPDFNGTLILVPDSMSKDKEGDDENIHPSSERSVSS